MKNLITFLVIPLLITFAADAQLPTLKTSTATNITATSVNICGNVTEIGGSPVSERGIVYNTTTSPDITVSTDTKIPSGTGLGSFTTSIISLTPNTAYHMRAYASNTSGTRYGDEIIVNTLTTTSANLKDIDKENSTIQAFIANQKTSIFKFGISIAVRTGFNFGKEKQARAIATITPNENLVSIDFNDLMAVVISTTIAAYPFKTIKDKDGNPKKAQDHANKFFSNFGFLANVNLIEFANSNTTTVFNKQVDGGLGFSYLLGTKEQFAIAITYERISVRQPTQFVFDHEGKQIIGDNGTALTTLDSKDSRYYRDAGMNGASIKFIYHFN